MASYINNEFVILLILSLQLILVKAGDGVGNTIIKALKTTTPLIRPQRNGFYLNVHEQEAIPVAEEMAIKAGLESQIQRIWDNVHQWENDIVSEGFQLKRDVAVSRALDTLNNNIRDFNKGFNIIFF